MRWSDTLKDLVALQSLYHIIFLYAWVELHFAGPYACCKTLSDKSRNISSLHEISNMAHILDLASSTFNPRKAQNSLRREVNHIWCPFACSEFKNESWFEVYKSQK